MDLLNQVWSDVIVTPDSVYQAVASLRRLLGDDPKHPTYIATVPRLGYQLVATVSPWPDQRPDQTIAQTPATIPAPMSGPRRKAAFPGPPERRFPSRSSLLLLSCSLFSFGQRPRAAITRPHPPLLRSHRNPSPCCRFLT